MDLLLCVRSIRVVRVHPWSALAFASCPLLLCASVSLWWILFLCSRSFFSVRSVFSVVNTFLPPMLKSLLTFPAADDLFRLIFRG